MVLSGRTKEYFFLKSKKFKTGKTIRQQLFYTPGSCSVHLDCKRYPELNFLQLAHVPRLVFPWSPPRPPYGGAGVGRVATCFSPGMAGGPPSRLAEAAGEDRASRVQLCTRLTEQRGRCSKSEAFSQNDVETKMRPCKLGPLRRKEEGAVFVLPPCLVAGDAPGCCLRIGVAGSDCRPVVLTGPWPAASASRDLPGSAGPQVPAAPPRAEPVGRLRVLTEPQAGPVRTQLRAQAPRLLSLEGWPALSVCHPHGTKPSAWC